MGGMDGLSVVDEEEPLEIRAPNKKESLEMPPSFQLSPSPMLPEGVGPNSAAAGGDFYYDSKMYTVATNKTIKNLMKEYKKRKVQHSRSVFVRKPFQEMKDPQYDPNKSADDNFQTVSILIALFLT